MTVGRPRWTPPSVRSTAWWSLDARTTSAPPDLKRGWGYCVRPPDPCTTLPRGPHSDDRWDARDRHGAVVPAATGNDCGAAGRSASHNWPDPSPSAAAGEIDARVAHALEYLRELHECGEIEWTDVSPGGAGLAFMDG